MEAHWKPPTTSPILTSSHWRSVNWGMRIADCVQTFDGQDKDLEAALEQFREIVKAFEFKRRQSYEARQNEPISFDILCPRPG